MKLLDYLKENNIDYKKSKKGLNVGGNLYLQGTQITSLPDGLNVGGYLDLRGTQITSLPDHLKPKIIVTIENKGKWTVKVSKKTIYIGCESKSKTGWKEFFKNKEYFDTNPKSYPEDYKAIQEDFENAVIMQKKFFK